MKQLLLTLAIAAFTLSCTKKAFAQDEPKVAVAATINQLFDGMRQSDSAMVRNTMHKDVRMHTTYVNKAGETKLALGNAEKFINAVGQPKDEVWNEVLDDIEIKIDGPLAQVWTPYRFYVGENFSHCGVNAFQLVNTVDGWKILNLTDTRQKEGCE